LEQGQTSPFAFRPRLVFWETTRACLLACRHCRAEAEPTPRPGELTTEEGFALLEAIAGFGAPPPLVVFTGGDLLMRADIDRLLGRAHALGLTTAVSPAVTGKLTREQIARFAELRVHSLSVSLDGMEAVHDRIRGVAGTFRRSVGALREAMRLGLAVQVNTVVMRPTIPDLPDLAALLLDEGVPVWEVFFLVPTGRAAQDLLPTAWEIWDVLHFLLDVGRFGLTVRTVEGPFLRRVLRERLEEGRFGGPLWARLSGRFTAGRGAPKEEGYPRLRRGTLDGDGIVFVAYDGEIYPGGLLPLSLGNVRRDSLVEVYRSHPLLKAIRARAFDGPCGSCADRFTCGGSRARAYVLTGDPLGSDPSCLRAWAA